MFKAVKDKALARRIKDHFIGKEHVFFAVVQPGFENTASRELARLGLNLLPGLIEGGVEFKGRPGDCYMACIMCRSASRIFMRLGTFRSGIFDLLERDIVSFPWELYIPYGRQILFRSSSRKSMIYHTGKLEEIFSRGIDSRLKDFENSYDTMDESARRPCTLHLRNDKDSCYVSLDASGEFLYKRGHRSFVNRAPLRESTASLILLEANVEMYSRIVDPMCGSGTFSIEAAGILTGAAASPDRDFPFFYWPGFKENNFNYIKNECLAVSSAGVKPGFDIITSDIEVKSLAAAKLNCETVFPGLLNPVHKDFFEIKLPHESKGKTLLVLNPPYGRRMVRGETTDLYRKIGEKIAKDFPECGFAIIAPGLEAEKALALDFHRKIPFMNGGVRSAVLFRDA